MKFSRRYKGRIKKSITLGLTSVITVMLVAIAMFKNMPATSVKQAEQEIVSLAEAHIGENANNPKANVASETGFQQDLDDENTYYIYDLEGLEEFRDRVNGENGYEGETFENKSIYLMSDIDMSSKYSEETGLSWTPIGVSPSYDSQTKKYVKIFQGYFNGNYHIINNMYINNTSYSYVGLFGRIFLKSRSQDGTINIIENIIIKTPKILNSYSPAHIGGIIGSFGSDNPSNSKTLFFNFQNIAIVGGTIDSVANCNAGGIIGIFTNNSSYIGININNCYSSCDIWFTGNGTNYNYKIGGIIGYAGNSSYVNNCYNAGKLGGDNLRSNALSGIMSRQQNFQWITNSYNYGELYHSDARYAYGITNGDSQVSTTNSYCIDNVIYSKSSVTNFIVDSETLKGYASTLGDAYEDDIYNINNGYPVLKWQNEHIEAFLNIVSEINTPQDLTDFRDSINNDNTDYTGMIVKINNDIDMTGITWTEGIGNATMKFTGTLEGNGHIIKNFNVSCGSVFDELENTANIQNIVFVNSNVNNIVNSLSGGTLNCVAVKGNNNIVNTATSGTIENCYSTGNSIYNTNSDATIKNSYGKNSDGTYSEYIGTNLDNVNEETLKQHVVKLGNMFGYDYDNSNGKLPKLIVEEQNKTVKLNKNQVYISVGDEMTLNISGNEDTLTWSSSNENIAMVDSTGKVTGIAEGETTIYAYNSTTEVYSMAIINVATKVAYSQIENSDGFEVILKQNGKVYAIGKNNNGQLGNGTTEDSHSLVTVKKDSTNFLMNIVKISVGNNYVLALDNEGNVYKWGNGTNYATLINGLENIVDIDAGIGIAVALDKDGKVYNIANNLVEMDIQNIIDVSCGNGFITALDSSGYIWCYGNNTNGQLGINCTDNTTWFMKSTKNVISISDGLNSNNIKKIDGKIYSAGDINNTQEYTELTLPSSVTSENKVTYIKGGESNITILLEDGTIWTLGSNTNGELGNGTYTDSSTFVQGLKEDGTALINGNIIGRNIQNGNTSVVLDNGEVYTTGDNTYGVVSKNQSITKTNYFTQSLDATGKILEIYNENDLIEFKNSVSDDGLAYDNSTVNLMNDIMISNDWTSIGTNSTHFNGTFNGNYHTISNLDNPLFYYIDSEGSVQNLILDVSISADQGGVGGLVCRSSGRIQNVGVNGTIRISGVNGGTVGGIAGVAGGIIKNCYNKASVSYYDESESYHSSFDNVYIGGIVGYCDGVVDCCYNVGNVNVTCKKPILMECLYLGQGGIVGYHAYSIGNIKGCYNAYSIKGFDQNGVKEDINCIGGIVGNESRANVYTGEYVFEGNKNYSVSISNRINYNLLTGRWYRYSVDEQCLDTKETLKQKTVKLGSAYVYDVYNINNGLPVLAWENETEVLALNINQTTINKNESITLNVVENENITDIPDYQSANFNWTSSNPEIATASNGVVTGHKEGQATIYAEHGGTGMKAMAIINVKEHTARAMTETGNGFTVMLRGNGNVHSIGANDKGQLGDGTLECSDRAVEVRIDENTTLGGVSKISVGYNSAMALTADGEVYTWGNGSQYATKIEGLSNIVDIACGNNLKVVLDKDGNVYKLGDEVTKLDFEKIIQISVGDDNLTALDSAGVTWTTGRNDYGQAGINCKDNFDWTMKSALDVAQVSNGSLHSTILKLNGDVYTTGDNTNKKLGTNNSEQFEYKKVNISNINGRKVTKVASGTSSTSVLLSDGTVYTAGKTGAIGNGGNYDSSSFVQAKTDNETYLTNVINIGKSVGTSNATAIMDNGNVYTSGDNSKCQIGDSTTNTALYFTAMGYIGAVYPHEIEILIDSEGKILNADDILFTDTAFNVFYDAERKISLIDKIRVLDDSVVTYEDNTIKPKNLGDTILVLDDEDTKSFGYIPVKVVMNEGDVSADVKAGKDFTLALKYNGKVYSFGTNANGELGLEKSTSSENVPNDVNIDLVKQIATGTSHSVALGKDGKVYTWGLNDKGQLGDGTVKTNKVPTAVEIPDNERIVKVLARGKATYAVAHNGNVYAWGEGYGTTPRIITEAYFLNNGVLVNTNETLTYDEEIQSELDVKPEKIIKASRSDSHTMMLFDNGEVYGYGTNLKGNLGNATNDDSDTLTLVGLNIVDTNSNNLVLSKGQTFDLTAEVVYFNLLLDKDGDITFESSNSSVAVIDTQSGVITAVNEGTTTVVAKQNGSDDIAVVQIKVIPADISIEPQVVSSGSHSLALKVDGSVWAWGQNEYGELGNGTKNYTDDPVKALFPSGTVIKQIAVGEYFSMALDTDGNVWTWGRNNNYQLGNKNNTDLSRPTKLTTIKGVIKIAAGSESAYAITSDKLLYGWGLNSSGELGVGTFTSRIAEPTRAKSITSVIDIEAGSNHAIALRSTGEVFVTGANNYNQFGNSLVTTSKKSKFVKVNTLNNVARIGATGAGNVVAKLDGSAYSFGSNVYGEIGQSGNIISLPTAIAGASNIADVNGGKSNSMLLDSNGDVYVAGSNRFGQLGNGTKTSIGGFQKVNDLENVTSIGSGTNYNVVALKDGTVWAFGDYNQGDTDYRSKTNSSVPAQVGGASFDLGTVSLTIKKGKKADIIEKLKDEFNLINLNTDNSVGLSYLSLNSDIASVDDYGDVLGKEVGTTWVKVIEPSGKEHAVFIYVIEEDSTVSPLINGGESNALVLNEDGTLYGFGKNTSGELGIGSSKTTDVPVEAQTLTKFKQISTSDNFSIALKADGTVWSFGDNTYGQLGLGNNTNANVPTKVTGLSNIVQIATGNNFALALDDFGMLYGMGKLPDGTVTNTPIAINNVFGNIYSIWAGENQIVAVNPKGEAYGMGSILNGKLLDVENVVKVQVGNGFIAVLDTYGDVYKYDGVSVTKYTAYENIVDIAVNDSNIVAQTKDKKAYINGELETLNNVYRIGTGTNSEYIIATTGEVYGKGENSYGQLGNKTRLSSGTLTFVGDNTFKVNPEKAILYVGATENLNDEITINEFNVFNNEIRKDDTFTFESLDTSKVSVTNGVATGVAKGKATINVVDTNTGIDADILRVVMLEGEDRIKEISVDAKEAQIADENKYEVEVENKGMYNTVRIKTNINTDKISIDEGETWFLDGELETRVKLEDRVSEIPIRIMTADDTVYNFVLEVTKKSNDANLKSLKVDGVEVKATSSKSYEITVEESVDLSQIVAVTNSDYAEVAINGADYKPVTASANVEYKNKYELNIPIMVKSEIGDEVEYTLTIYRKCSALELEKVEVNGSSAYKIADAKYIATIANEQDRTAEVMAKAIQDTAKVSIDGNEAEVQVSTRTVNVSNNLTEIIIRASGEVAGQSVFKDYYLSIYKNIGDENLNLILVNDTIVNKNEDGDYEIYLSQYTDTANVKVIAKNKLFDVSIENWATGKGSVEADVDTPDNRNEYTIIVTDLLGVDHEYTLLIKKPKIDTLLEKVTISDGNNTVIAQQDEDDVMLYRAKVLNADKYLVTAETDNINSYVSLDGTARAKHITTKVINKLADLIIVEIEVESENGNLANYELEITVMSDDDSLDYVEVAGLRAAKQEDGTYLVRLENSDLEVDVTAVTTDSKAKIRIGTEEETLHIAEETVIRDSKETKVSIYVTAEDGIHKTKYTLRIGGVSDDATLQSVVVNNKEATFVEGENRYVVRITADEYNVTATATDTLAGVQIDNFDEETGVSTRKVNKAGELTTATIKVIAQNGEEDEFTLEIIEESSNANIAFLKVDGKAIAPSEEDDHIYNATVSVSEDPTEIFVEAEETHAKVFMDKDTENEYTENTSTITVEKQISDRLTTYKITVVAENGVTEEYTLNVTLLATNLDLKKITGTIENTSNDPNAEDTVVEAVLKDDGTYFLKVGNTTKVDLKAITDDENAFVRIEANDYTQGEAEYRMYTPNSIQTAEIYVKAEDGTEVETPYILVVETISEDTGLKTINSDDILGLYMNNETKEHSINVDNNLTSVTLDIVTNSDYADLKLSDEEEYVNKTITRTFDLTEDETTFTVDVKAENGNVAQHTVRIVKSGNVKLESVVVGGNTIISEDDYNYNARVNVANTTATTVTAKNRSAKVEILDYYEVEYDEDDNPIEVTENIRATGTGVATVNLPSNQESQKFFMRVTSSDESASATYILTIEPKSQDTSLKLVSIDEDEITAIDKVYTKSVYGKDEYSLKIETNDEKAKVKISYDDYVSEEYTNILAEDLELEEQQTINAIITVVSENGDSDTYSLVVKRVSEDSSLELVKVNDIELTDYDEDTHTYRIMVDNRLETADLIVKAKSPYTSLTIDEDSSLEIISKEVTLLGADKITSIQVKAKAQNGDEEIYTVEIKQISDRISLDKVIVNDIEATARDLTRYEVHISNKDEFANVEAIAREESSYVAIGDNGKVKTKDTKKYRINGLETIETTIVVTSKDESLSQEYTLVIYMLDSDLTLEYVKADDITATYNEKTKTYRAIIDKDATVSMLDIKANSDTAALTVSGETGIGSVSKEINVLGVNKVTQSNIKVVAQDGTEESYTLEILQLTDEELHNASGKEVKVDDVVVVADGTEYKAMIKAVQDKAQIDIETVSNYAKIKLADFEEEEHILSTKVDCDLNEDVIILPFTITAPDGETKENYTIKLVRGSNDTSVIIKANDEVLTNVDNKYEYSTLDTTPNIVVNGTLTGTPKFGDSAGTIDINNTGLAEATIPVSTIENKTLTVPVKVTAEDGTEEESEVVITIISTDASQKSIVVNEDDIVRNPEITGENEYTTGIKYLTESVEVVVTANDADAKVSHNGVEEAGTLTFNVDITGDSTEVEYEITAQDGTTKTEYKLIINKMSNNVGVLSVKVNDEVVDVSESDVVNMTVKATTENVKVEVEKAEEAQTIIINTDETTEKTIPMPGNTLTVTIDIIAEDGTTETKTINIYKSATIAGKVITENVNGIHKASVTVYKSNDLTTPVATLDETDDDGSFEVEVYKPGVSSNSDLNAEYTIVIRKPGYLSYTLTNITLQASKARDVGEHKLIAGNIVEYTKVGNKNIEQIEVEDLVALNDNYGVVITDVNRATHGIYDLNEDGVVDKKDRDILKANYNKKATVKVWVNISLYNFVLPTASSYTINSPYGDRLHPTKGVIIKHTGIDLGVAHHSEVLSIADGEVTFAGEQSGYGYCVEIKHIVNGVAIYSFYAHLSQIDVNVGDVVAQGQKIGLEGGAETDPGHGTSTGHHLHFEIRTASGSGNDVNPCDYINF